MKYDKDSQMNFISEMAEHQILANEFFGPALLVSLKKNFELGNLSIDYFDTSGHFLSNFNCSGVEFDESYKQSTENNIIRQTIYQEAIHDRLNYYNVTPKLYKATDYISESEYHKSDYIKSLNASCDVYYSVIMAFGVNAYIQLTCFKSLSEGNFSKEEMDILENIYVYVANAYKNFKKHEREKIVSIIQNKVISSGDKAYLINDQFMHIISHNDVAKGYLRNIWGPEVSDDINSTTPCAWLPFLLGRAETHEIGEIKTRIIQDYTFKINTYDKQYTNGITDRYYWITIVKNSDIHNNNHSNNISSLTSKEKLISELMCSGLTYKGIAEELDISYHTVKKHVQNIYSKCGVKSRHQLYQYLVGYD